MSRSRLVATLRCPALCAFILLGAGHARAEDTHEVAEFKARAGSVTATAISPDGKYVLTGEDDGLVTLWSVDGKEPSRNYMGHDRTVLAAALLPDGKRGVTSGDDNKLILWDFSTGKRLFDLSTGDAVPVTMSCSADGRFAATGDLDGGIMVWDLDNGKRLTTLHRRSPVCGLTFSPDGSVIAAGYANGEVILWSTSDWAPRMTLPPGDGASVGALAFSSDAKMLVTGNQEGVAIVWNPTDGKQIATLNSVPAPDATPTPPAAPVFPGGAITPGDHGAVVFVCVGPGSTYTLAGYQNTIPKLWETKTGRLVDQYPWLTDTKFYGPRYGFPFAAASVTQRRDFLVTMKENLAKDWRVPFAHAQ